MPDPTPVNPDPILAAATVAGADASQRSIARQVASPLATVQKMLARYAPVREALGQIQREPLLAMFQTHAMGALDAIDEGGADLKAKDRQQLMLAAAIATDKALLLAGQPTVIGAVLHAHRVELPEALARAVRVARMAPEDLAEAAGLKPGVSQAPVGSGEPDPGESGS